MPVTIGFTFAEAVLTGEPKRNAGRTPAQPAFTGEEQLQTDRDLCTEVVDLRWIQGGIPRQSGVWRGIPCCLRMTFPAKAVLAVFLTAV